MNVDFSQFDKSAVVVLKALVKQFPSPTEVGFNDIFPEDEIDTDKRAAHIGVLAFLRHEDLISHEVGSASSFIITRKGLALFDADIFKHLKSKLNELSDNL
jgi:hypothetical protein